MRMGTRLYKQLLAIAVLAAFVACDKVSPTGVLIGNTGVDDRAKMSLEYYQNYNDETYYLTQDDSIANSGYSFLVGSDSHLAEDTGRLAEMMQMGLDNNDILCAHLGDIADTKAEYYILLSKLLDSYNEKYRNKVRNEYFDYDSINGTYTFKDSDGVLVDSKEDPCKDLQFPFYVAVGNHDITHNGWALFSNIFHSSFFQVTVPIDYDNMIADRFIFLDSANGTMGNYQIESIDNNDMLDDWGYETRNLFVFTHSNFFRPTYNQFSSTYAREELYYLLNKFSEWNTKIVFAGHVHAWDDREVGGVRYLTLESMSERNSPDPGDYLVRVHVSKDGDVSYERVHMNYVKK